MEKIGVNHSLTTCNTGSSLAIQGIRQKSNEELPTSFTSTGLFIGVPFLAFGYDAWETKKQDKQWRKHTQEYAEHTKQGPNCMIESRWWVTTGLPWCKTALTMQKGASLASFMQILFINLRSHNHSIQLWLLGHLKLGGLMLWALSLQNLLLATHTSWQQLTTFPNGHK